MYCSDTITVQIQSQIYLHSKLNKVTLVPFVNEMLLHLQRRLQYHAAGRLCGYNNIQCLTKNLQ